MLFNNISECVSKYQDSGLPYKNIAVLKLYVNQINTDLVNVYENAVKEHNRSTLENRYYNSGFDLFLPEDENIRTPIDSHMINLEVKGEMCLINTRSLKQCPSAYLLHPRSSFSKVPLVLANHTGIIDSGYRGNLLAAVRWLKDPSDYSPLVKIQKHTRLFQVCHPSLCPLFVVLVKEEELSKTERGEGGFGSTGK